MNGPGDVPPDSLPIDLTEDGIEVEYLDGRSVFYHGVPTPVEGSVTTAPAKEVHVLVTAADETRGVLVYVNDLNTGDDVLAESGVGRVMLDRSESETIFPGVEITERGMRIEVAADPSVVDGRVFVFEEDAMGERRFEIVADAPR